MSDDEEALGDVPLAELRANELAAKIEEAKGGVLFIDEAYTLVGRGEKEVAAFLGSGQRDPSVEDRALSGGYPLVYMSPEKLMAGGTLDRLASLGREALPGVEALKLQAVAEARHRVQQLTALLEHRTPAVHRLAKALVGEGAGGVRGVDVLLPRTRRRGRARGAAAAGLLLVPRHAP